MYMAQQFKQCRVYTVNTNTDSILVDKQSRPPSSEPIYRICFMQNWAVFVLPSIRIWYEFPFLNAFWIELNFAVMKVSLKRIDMHNTAF